MWGFHLPLHQKHLQCHHKLFPSWWTNGYHFAIIYELTFPFLELRFSSIDISWISYLLDFSVDFFPTLLLLSLFSWTEYFQDSPSCTHSFKKILFAHELLQCISQSRFFSWASDASIQLSMFLKSVHFLYKELSLDTQSSESLYTILSFPSSFDYLIEKILPTEYFFNWFPSFLSVVLATSYYCYQQ
jgi:hypothetical protein